MMGGGRGVKVFREFLKTGRMPEVDEQDGQPTEVADFVVVGAGSAGCVVAELPTNCVGVGKYEVRYVEL
jgi:hypothetical protein